MPHVYYAVCKMHPVDAALWVAAYWGVNPVDVWGKVIYSHYVIIRA